MAEDSRHDRQFLTLFESERRAGVAHVGGALQRESGRRERCREAVQHVRASSDRPYEVAKT